MHIIKHDFHVDPLNIDSMKNFKFWSYNFEKENLNLISIILKVIKIYFIRIKFTI